MYDLNLSVPNLTSPKYSNDNRFLLLKNYLYELNETLSFALGDKPQTEIQNLKKEIETGKGEEKQNLTVEMLIAKFQETGVASDRTLLSN